MGSISNSQKVWGIFFLLVFLAAGGAGLASIFPTVSNQGYAPEQPIPFSHKIHTGINKIDCKYCHSNVERSRHSTIPSVGVCMNCHMVVKTDSPWIQKLQEHYNTGKPVEWVRVHELPDHAYFPHNRHVKAGVSCQTCHGPVEEMDVVYQYSSLTMGWCMTCHRGGTPAPSEIVDRLGQEDSAGRKQIAPTNCSTCHH